MVNTDGVLWGGKVTANPLDEAWCGATKATIVAAELTGILQALLWTEERHAREPVDTLWLRSDSQASLSQAEGRTRGKEHTALQDRIHAQL